MKYCFSFALIFFNFIALAYADYRTFDLGFKQGYQSVEGRYALAPITPIKPITPIGSSDYLEGFKQGVLEAGSRNQENLRSSSPRAKTVSTGTPKIDFSPLSSIDYSTSTAAVARGLEIKLQAHNNKRERERMALREFAQQRDMQKVVAAQISAKLMVYPKLKKYIQVNAPRSLQRSLKYMDNYLFTNLADLNALDAYISTLIELDAEKFQKLEKLEPKGIQKDKRIDKYFFEKLSLKYSSES
mgnify:CR=1 FL=1